MKKSLILCLLGIISYSVVNAASLRVQSPGDKEKEFYVVLKNGYKSVDISNYTGWDYCEFDAKTYFKKSKKVEISHLKCHTKTKQQVLVSCQSHQKIEIYLGDSNTLNEGGGVIEMQCGSE